MTFETEIAKRSQRADELVRQGRAQLRQVVVDAHRRGLSQRRIAALTGRSQPEVGRLLREIAGPVRPWLTAIAAAEAIKGELERGDEDFALRTLIGAINDFRGLQDTGEIQDFLRRPRPTGHRPTVEVSWPRTPCHAHPSIFRVSASGWTHRRSRRRRRHR